MPRSRRTTPGHAAIIAYWKEHMDRLNRRGWTLDGLSPDLCFACGIGDYVSLLAGKETVGSPVLSERHHIVPFEFTQDDRPENLHLLCHRCHKEAPHCRSPEVYWDWFGQRLFWMDRYSAAVRRVFGDLGVTEEEAERINALGTGWIEQALEEMQFQRIPSSLETPMRALILRARQAEAS